MNVSLLSRTLAPGATCSAAAAICTNAKDAQKALRGALASGHESVIEHASFTFEIRGVSRVLLAQLTRHRIASFSVMSQRYVRLTGAEVVMPETIKEKFWGENFKRLVMGSLSLYQMMVDGGVPEEDARYIVPQGIKTDLIMTMNARELRHFFALRCCNRAQWEIRQLADEMLALCKEAAPDLFDKAGPGCVRGHCPEGRRSCGHPRTKEDKTNG